MIQMTVYPGHFAVAEVKPDPRTNQPAVQKIGKPSSGQISSDQSQARPQRQPTEAEIKMARELAEAGMTGPPPAFQVSVLEAQSDLRYILQHKGDAYQKAAADLAIEPHPKPELPAGE